MMHHECMVESSVIIILISRATRRHHTKDRSIDDTQFSFSLVLASFARLNLNYSIPRVKIVLKPEANQTPIISRRIRLHKTTSIHHQLLTGFASLLCPVQLQTHLRQNAPSRDYESMTVLLKNLFTVHFQFDLLKLETNNTRDDKIAMLG